MNDNSMIKMMIDQLINHPEFDKIIDDKVNERISELNLNKPIESNKKRLPKKIDRRTLIDWLGVKKQTVKIWFDNANLKSTIENGVCKYNTIAALTSIINLKKERYNNILNDILQNYNDVDDLLDLLQNN